MNDSLLFLINGWAGHSSLLDAVMTFCAKDLIYIVFAIAAICLGMLFYRREWRQAIYFLVALAVSFIVLQIMAHIYVDHRPFVDHHVTQLIPHAAGKSFPSDHTTVSVAIALGMLIFTQFKKIGASLLAVALLIGFSRIFVGVHYPVDILGGIITGLIGTGIVALIRALFTPAKNSTPVQFDPKN